MVWAVPDKIPPISCCLPLAAAKIESKTPLSTRTVVRDLWRAKSCMNESVERGVGLKTSSSSFHSINYLFFQLTCLISFHWIEVFSTSKVSVGNNFMWCLAHCIAVEFAGLLKSK